MKKLLFSAFLIWTTFSYSQSNEHVCTSPANLSPTNKAIMDNFNNNSSTSKAVPNGTLFVCVRLYFHVIRRTDGSGGVTQANVNDTFNILINDFGPRNISFNWNGTIDFIDDTAKFNARDTSIFNTNNSTNGIDVYIFSDTGTPLATTAGNGFPFIAVGGLNTASNFSAFPVSRSHIITHEMGHVFDLYHTHQGTAAFTGGCPELVNGSNSNTCGDFISDTPADPNIQGNNPIVSCTTWSGTLTDANGQLYNPNLRNYMSYTKADCMTRFSPKQASRMRYALLNLPTLQPRCIYSYVIDPISPPPIIYTACQISTTASFTVFPNPANTELNITTLNKEANKEVNYKLFSLTFNDHLEGTFKENSKKIHTSSLPNGSYALHLYIDNELIIKNIIINH